jgi:hypothetical protein
MRLNRFVPLALALTALTACEPDAGPFEAPTVPTAYVRFVNAVPDTLPVELRFIDKVEGSAWFGQPAFRTVTNYFPVHAGERKFRIFPTDPSSVPDINIVTQILQDVTTTFQAERYYTVVHTGYTRAGATPEDRVIIMEDVLPSVPSGQIAVRAVNLDPTGPVAVYGTATGGTSPLGTALFPTVAYGAASSYANTGTGTLVFRATPAGATTVMAEATAPAGRVAASVSQSNQGGYSIAGSILTAFVFPRSVAGSRAPQTAAFTTPGVVWMQDNEP